MVRVSATTARGALITSTTAVSISDVAIAVRAVIVSPAKTQPRKSATTGLTNAYVATFEAVLFFSPSAVRNFLNWDAGKGGPVLRSISDSSRKTAVVAIGPVTAVALRDAGLRNIVQAADTTVASVIEALETFFAASSS